ncbi:Tigger transposable element-derived protein 6 [Dictyocoela muelleri]|nr:Tigger transposable element-derived protein 6 [Dictyocoela muelleri]
MSNKGEKKTRKRLTLVEKVEILDFHEKNPSITQRDLSEKYKLSLGTLNGILKSKEKIVENKNKISKNIVGNFKTKIMDDKLFEWFVSKRRRLITIQDSNLQDKALEMASICGIENFSASSGWLQCFKKRHQISSKMISGESGMVDINIIEDFKHVYTNKLKSYKPEDIFNCDETGLFFKCSTNRTLCHVEEDQISGKFSKERLTLLFCVSMAGEKLHPLMIGKAKSPRGFKNLDFDKLGITYEHNKKSWMRTEIFCRWLKDLNDKMIKENRKILLTLDNAPVHPIDVEYSNIELLYFPPNLTSRIQPLDQGIIKSFKSIYKRKFNNKLNNEYDLKSTDKYQDLIKRFKILDALLLIIASWCEVSDETIVKCYRKALKNSLLDPVTLFSEPIVEQDTNNFSCYPENLTEEEIMVELRNEIEQTKKYNDKDSDHESSSESESLAFNRQRLTNLDFYDRLNDIELYLAESRPEVLESFYSFKKDVEAKFPKKFNTLLDFIRKT